MPNCGLLRVRLSHAIGLRSMDSNGYSDPYVKLTLGKETHKSEIVKKSLNPRWDKDYFFRGGFEQLVALPLQVHAWDYDRQRGWFNVETLLRQLVLTLKLRKC